MMRCVPEAKQVAALLTDAWMASTGLSSMETQDIRLEQAGAQTV